MKNIFNKKLSLHMFNYIHLSTLICESLRIEKPPRKVLPFVYSISILDNPVLDGLKPLNNSVMAEYKVV